MFIVINDKEKEAVAVVAIAAAIQIVQAVDHHRRKSIKAAMIGIEADLVMHLDINPGDRSNAKTDDMDAHAAETHQTQKIHIENGEVVAEALINKNQQSHLNDGQMTSTLNKIPEHRTIVVEKIRLQIIVVVHIFNWIQRILRQISWIRAVPSEKLSAERALPVSGVNHHRQLSKYPL